MLGFHASVISLVLFPGKGLEMRGVRFRAARLSLSGQKGCHVFCLFLGKGLEIRDVQFCYGTGGPGWMHPSGYWMLDFYASVVSLVLFLGKGLENAGCAF